MLLYFLSIGLQETEMGRHVKYIEDQLRTFGDLVFHIFVLMDGRLWAKIVAAEKENVMF